MALGFLACVYILGVFFVADSSAVYEPCDDAPVPLSLRIPGCETSPCIFQRGTDARAECDFEVTENTKSLKPVVRVTTLGVTVNYPLPEQNACNSLTNGECPLEKGEEVTYSLSMPILKFYPKVSLDIQLSLVDENDNTQVCFKIKAKVA